MGEDILSRCAGLTKRRAPEPALVGPAPGFVKFYG